jgi:16S rRNA (guanine1516-N2)-methyltransferase
MQAAWQGQLAVLQESQGYLMAAQQLAARLAVPVIASAEAHASNIPLFLVWRDGCLKLVDHDLLKKGGLMVDVEPRPGEQRSWPAPKQGDLAKALGRKTQTVVDATTGWGQDSLAIFRMGYNLTCIERSPIMAELLTDGFYRLGQTSWVQSLQLQPPALLVGNAIELLANLGFTPDCIYLDPMFPPKRKQSALAKKPIQLLRSLIGDDLDKAELFTAAWQVAGKRVVVKSPDDAEPLAAKPQVSYQGKLVRYDVYLK